MSGHYQRQAEEEKQSLQSLGAMPPLMLFFHLLFSKTQREHSLLGLPQAEGHPTHCAHCPSFVPLLASTALTKTKLPRAAGGLTSGFQCQEETCTPREFSECCLSCGG